MPTNKSRSSRPLQPGDILTLDDLPPGSCAVEMNYLYFLADLFLNLRKDLNVNNGMLRSLFAALDVSDPVVDDTIAELDKCTSGQTELSSLGTMLMAMHDEIADVEGIIRLILINNGFSWKKRQDRLKTHAKIMALVTTDLVTYEEKVRYVAKFDRSVIDWASRN